MKFQGLTVLVFLFGYAYSAQIVIEPVTTAVKRGADGRLNCTLEGELGEDLLTWSEHISDAAGALIYSTDMDDTNDPDDYDIVGTYDLIVKDTDTLDGGYYACKLGSNERKLVALIVVDAPVIIQNAVDFVEGNIYNLGCNVNFGLPTAIPVEEIVPKILVNVDNRIVMEQKIEEFKGVVGVTPSSQSVSFNFTALPEYDGKEIGCTLAIENLEFSSKSSETVHVLHRTTSVDIVRRERKYRVGEKIKCSANGNPEPEYEWTSNTATGPSSASGNELVIKSSMIGENDWDCTATNDVQGAEGSATTNIKFEVVDEPYGGSASNVILATGSILLMFVCHLL